MPLEDALTLITRKFDKYVITKKERLASSSALTHPAGRAFNPPGPNVVYLLNLLVDGRFLTLAELDLVLDYVSERRDCLLKSEGLSARGYWFFWPPHLKYLKVLLFNHNLSLIVNRMEFILVIAY